LGNTNIVSRPTRNGSELSKKEMDDSVHVLEEKIGRYKPEAVCLVGKSIWESVWRKQKGKAIKKEEFRYGWQDDGERMAEKERIWRELGVWVEKRREERGRVEIEEEV